MKINWQDNLVLSIGIASGIITLVAAGLERLWLAYFGAGLIFALVATLVWLQRNLAVQEIKIGMKFLEAQLTERGIKPDLLIAFDRSGGMFACMFSVHIRLQSVLVLPRNRLQRTNRMVSIGEGIQIDGEKFKNQCVVIVTYHMSTGDTLDAAMLYLSSQKVNPAAIISLYITPGARVRYPALLFAYEHPSNRESLNRLPWVDGKYIYL